MGNVVITGRGRRGISGGHPWIYTDAVSEGLGEPGELLPVFDPNGNALGWGLYSSTSKITVRLVTRENEQPNREFWAERMRRCVAAREKFGMLDPKGACRLVAGDADGFPGMVIDRYADVLVLQSGCQASDRMLPFLLELAEESLPFPVRAVLDRSDASVRRLEGLESRVEWLRGGPIASVEVREAARGDAPELVYEVEPAAGHKTGHYLDQVDNRRRAADFASGARVLDAFSYDGLFGVRAALAGATSVLCLDQSAEAGERALRNAERNGVADRVACERTNVMHDLKRRVEEGEQYDLVVVDPPAFARNKREAEGAARGYRELNRRAMQLLAPGGVLVSASCSYNVKSSEFVDYLARASFDAGRDARLIALAGASPDHSVLLTLPESHYLKCAFLQL